MFEKAIFCVVATLAPSILIGSSSYLEVTRIAITSRMSSNFSQIRSLTAELSALDCVKNQFLARLHEVHRAIVVTSVVYVYVYFRVTLSVKVFYKSISLDHVDRSS